MTIIINLYGGPGTGKSTTAAATFAELKHQGVKVELVTEFAKDVTWEGNTSILEHQAIVLGEQLRRIVRLVDKVDVVITDSPIMLGAVYSKDNEGSSALYTYLKSLYREHNNVSVFLERVKEYQQYGRSQTEEEAKEIDSIIKVMLRDMQDEYYTVTADRRAARKIAKLARSLINETRDGEAGTEVSSRSANQ